MLWLFGCDVNCCVLIVLLIFGLCLLRCIILSVMRLLICCVFGGVYLLRIMFVIVMVFVGCGRRVCWSRFLLRLSGRRFFCMLSFVGLIFFLIVLKFKLCCGVLWYF